MNPSDYSYTLNSHIPHIPAITFVEGDSRSFSILICRIFCASTHNYKSSSFVLPYRTAGFLIIHPQPVYSMDKHIVIIGAGASGIAAATKLISNGFTNVTVLEAERQIGGRVRTMPFGSGLIDLGGQW